MICKGLSWVMSECERLAKHREIRRLDDTRGQRDITLGETQL